MIEESSFGIIPLQFRENEWQVFLVQLKAGHWGFPKGHANEGEKPQTAAERELFEETSLVVEKFFPFKPMQEQYTCEKSGQLIFKTVTYFFAKVKGSFYLQKSEILSGGWFYFSEAEEKLTFDEGRDLWNRAHKYLEDLNL